MFKHIARRLAVVAAVASLALVTGIAHGEQAAAEATPAAKPYPLNICVVSGAELGTMGDPVVIVHDGQEIKFCCAHCTPKFKADPEKYLKKVKDAEQSPTTQPADAPNAGDDHAHH